MRCVNVNEPDSNYFWFDNYLCVSDDMPYNFTWSSTGCVKDQYCIRFEEPATPIWNDNFLCAPKMNDCSYPDMSWYERICNSSIKKNYFTRRVQKHPGLKQN